MSLRDERSKFLVLRDHERAKLRNGGLSGHQLGKVPVLGFESGDSPAQFVKLRFEPIGSGLLRFSLALPDFGRLVVDGRADAHVSGGQGANGGKRAEGPTGDA
ncbi:hypothetical protein ACFUT3_30325 [Streptomyces cinereoruber]|uniref:hypothetical protein n=1 Tax=Streptomyces cinereoruber TaxID=67260 RepID=UPI003624BC23